MVGFASRIGVKGANGVAGSRASISKSFEANTASGGPDLENVRSIVTEPIDGGAKFAGTSLDPPGEFGSGS